MAVEGKHVSRSRQSSISVSKNVIGDQQGEDREELDFQFDEELDRPLPAVKQNTFTEWSDSDESECDEVGDDFINKVTTINNSTVTKDLHFHLDFRF